MDDELKEEIQAGTKLKKVDPKELKAAKAEKEKRIKERQEELQALAAKLEAEGISPESDEAPEDNPDESQ